MSRFLTTKEIFQYLHVKISFFRLPVFRVGPDQLMDVQIDRFPKKAFSCFWGQCFWGQVLQ